MGAFRHILNVILVFSHPLGHLCAHLRRDAVPEHLYAHANFGMLSTVAGAEAKVPCDWKCELLKHIGARSGLSFSTDVEVANNTSWSMIAFMLGMLALLVCVGVCCCEVDRAEVLKDASGKEFPEAGQEVVVGVSFHSDSVGETLLSQGLQGRVVEVDDEGDACIDFAGLQKAQWVKRRNFHKLQEDRVEPAGSQSLGSESAGNEPTKSAGTAVRMPNLPPTALASLGPSILPPTVHSNEKQLEPQQSPLLPSTHISQGMSGFSSKSFGSCFLPPALIPDFDSQREEACTWTIIYHLCRKLVLGSPIEVIGSPPLYAALIGDGWGSQLLLGRTPTLEAAEATIGPLHHTLPPDIAANIVGPDGQLYGFFKQDGARFAVTHHSRAGNVLTLEPVKTASGSFLEIAAEDGIPICLAQLNDPKGPGVVIDANPDVDAFLIISCVLACFVARPEILDDLPP